MLRRRRDVISSLVLGTALMAGVSMSCAAILGFERLSEEGAPDVVSETPPVNVPDAADAGPGVDSAGPCSEIGIPNPPATAEPGLVAPVLGAIRGLDFGVDVNGGRPAVPGFNLDRTCSTNIATSSCRTKLSEVAFGTHAKDKTASGVDNAGFSLIEFISAFSSVLNAEALNQAIAAGTYGAVFRIDRWNGKENDDDVVVEVFPAIGFNPLPDGGTRPNFNDNDQWILDERYKVGGVLEASTVRSDRAYVAGGRLIARFATVSLRLALVDDPKPFEIKLTDALFTGKLSATAGVDAGTDGSVGKSDDIFTEGVVAGRWKTSDFLGEVRTIFVASGSGLTNTTLCEPAATLIYNAVKDQICNGRDLRSDSKDNQNLPCDALSAGARVEAYRIRNLGTFGVAPDGGGRCTKPNSVPFGDDCASN